MMATDLLKCAWEDLYDIGIMVTGDGDFSYAVKTVKDFGKHVEVAAFEANLSLELLQIADTREFLPQNISKTYGVKKNLQMTTKQVLQDLILLIQGHPRILDIKNDHGINLDVKYVDIFIMSA